MKLPITDVNRPLTFFCEIAKIPHPSGQTKAIADYLENFAHERSLYCARDAHDNILIRKAATEGYEDQPTLILQGHTDMVAQKTPECQKDMEHEALTLITDGDFLFADGTTLGADDGVAVAYALAILDADDIPHPEIEALFTSDEEIGLIGATNLEVGPLHGKTLINIDSDAEGVFTVGCAGGVRCDIELPITRVSGKAIGYAITLGGGEGGHSGVEIDRGRANAIKELGALLERLGKIHIASIHAGDADNAIPCQAQATVIAEGDVEGIVRSFQEELSLRYATTDPKLFVQAERIEICEWFDDESTDRTMTLLSKIPTGIVAMSDAIEGLVETSLNFASIHSEKTLRVAVSVRSSFEQKKEEVVQMLSTVASSVGVDFSTRGSYPAWEYRGKTHLEEVMVNAYEELYGKTPEVLVIHAGLECGILSKKIDGLSAVSIGPNTYDIHTPRERLSLSSFKRVWEYLLAVIKRI